MDTLLHVDASILGDHSASRKLSAAVAERLKAANSGLKTVYRDLAATPLPRSRAQLAPVPSVAAPPLPFSPVKCSGLIDRLLPRAGR